jgi:hypothetical protein
VWVHAQGGVNRQPIGKIDAFARTLRENPVLAPNVAMMKLCYVDFEPETRARELVEHYVGVLGPLRRELPGTSFVHVTAPLQTRGDRLKDRALRLLGRPVWRDDANARRDEYNRLLLDRVAGEPVFDLAAVESTGADGSRHGFLLGGVLVPTLIPALTDDGGHLNAEGQRRAAIAMIRTVAHVLRAKARR